MSANVAHRETPDGPGWQRALRNAVRDPWTLLDRLDLRDSPLADEVAPDNPFPLRVPEAYLARMEPGNPNDPLLRQVLPLRAEDTGPSGYRKDPLEETGYLTAPGLLQKYRGRALMTVTGNCAVHCRYCFRRHFPYADSGAKPGQWQAALDALAQAPEVNEIILSGGDPLAVGDHLLSELAARLAEIPHLQRIRLHTRTPVVLPERIDATLLAWLTGTRLQPVVVVHANHPQEIDTPFRRAMAALREAGVTLLNQAVLLRGINDDPVTLGRLSERLFEANVLPYYLHVLDPVAGAAHFDRPDREAVSLVAALRDALPGYLVPRLVREIPGEASKTPLA